MASRTFGEIEGVPPGTWFASRRALHEAGVHRPLQAGIAGSERAGAESIVLSGGYEDDDDQGAVILYTGQGGRDPETGTQVAHQPLNRGNLALAKSYQDGLPVRVVRGAGSNPAYAPGEGYRYDGLYRVEAYWKEPGQSGFYVWRYRLRRIDTEASTDRIAEPPQRYEPAERVAARVVRIVRDSAQARALKRLYDHRCQVCGVRLEGAAGPYAEAAHLQPLGRPHDGPDVLENLLCLCPNHHVLFDYGAFALADDLALLGLGGHLITHAQHRPARRFVRYHRTHLWMASPESE